MPESNPTNPQSDETVSVEKWNEAAEGLVKASANNLLETTGAEVVMLLIQWEHDTKQIVAIKKDLRLDRLIVAALTITNGMSEVGLKAICEPEPEEETESDGKKE